MKLPFAVRFFFRRYFFRKRRSCPKCEGIGTFKAFDGTPLAGIPDRLLCKWCGFYENEFTWLQAHACVQTKSWQLPEKCYGSVCTGPPECREFTPREVLMVPHSGRPTHWPLANPWLG